MNSSIKCLSTQSFLWESRSRQNVKEEWRKFALNIAPIICHYQRNRTFDASVPQINYQLIDACTNSVNHSNFKNIKEPEEFENQSRSDVEIRFNCYACFNFVDVVERRGQKSTIKRPQTAFAEVHDRGTSDDDFPLHGSSNWRSARHGSLQIW